MAEVVVTNGLTLQIKSSAGDTFVKADVSMKVDDTKLVEDQLKWAQESAYKVWDMVANTLADKISEEEIERDKNKRGLVIRALKAHKDRLDTIDKCIDELRSKVVVKRGKTEK